MMQFCKSACTHFYLMNLCPTIYWNYTFNALIWHFCNRHHYLRCNILTLCHTILFRLKINATKRLTFLSVWHYIQDSMVWPWTHGYCRPSTVGTGSIMAIWIITHCTSRCRMIIMISSCQYSFKLYIIIVLLALIIIELLGLVEEAACDYQGQLNYGYLRGWHECCVKHIKEAKQWIYKITFVLWTGDTGTLRTGTLFDGAGASSAKKCESCCQHVSSRWYGLNSHQSVMRGSGCPNCNCNIRFSVDLSCIIILSHG